MAGLAATVPPPQTLHLMHAALCSSRPNEILSNTAQDSFMAISQSNGMASSTPNPKSVRDGWPLVTLPAPVKQPNTMERPQNMHRYDTDRVDRFNPSFSSAEHTSLSITSAPKDDGELGTEQCINQTHIPNWLKLPAIAEQLDAMQDNVFTILVKNIIRRDIYKAFICLPYVAFSVFIQVRRMLGFEGSRSWVTTQSQVRCKADAWAFFFFFKGLSLQRLRRLGVSVVGCV